MTLDVLAELETCKLPALRQAGARIASDAVVVVLFSRSGFSNAMVDAAAMRTDVILDTPEDLVSAWRAPVP